MALYSGIEPFFIISGKEKGGVNLSYSLEVFTHPLILSHKIRMILLVYIIVPAGIDLHIDIAVIIVFDDLAHTIEVNDLKDAANDTRNTR